MCGYYAFLVCVLLIIALTLQMLRQYKNSHDDAEVLMSALSAMQDKNAHLEKSLSAETRLKLDLFSALDDTKRQLDMTQRKRIAVSVIIR